MTTKRRRFGSRRSDYYHGRRRTMMRGGSSRGRGSLPPPPPPSAARAPEAANEYAWLLASSSPQIETMREGMDDADELTMEDVMGEKGFTVGSVPSVPSSKTGTLAQFVDAIQFWNLSSLDDLPLRFLDVVFPPTVAALDDVGDVLFRRQNAHPEVFAGAPFLTHIFNAVTVCLKHCSANRNRTPEQILLLGSFALGSEKYIDRALAKNALPLQDQILSRDCVRQCMMCWGDDVALPLVVKYHARLFSAGQTMAARDWIAVCLWCDCPGILKHFGQGGSVDAETCIENFAYRCMKQFVPYTHNAAYMARYRKLLGSSFQYERESLRFKSVDDLWIDLLKHLPKPFTQENVSVIQTAMATSGAAKAYEAFAGYAHKITQNSRLHLGRFGNARTLRFLGNPANDAAFQPARDMDKLPSRSAALPWLDASDPRTEWAMEEEEGEEWEG